MSIADYEGARQQGLKEYRAQVSRGQFPYLQVLDEVLSFTETQGEEALGLVDIPINRIVGTKTAGRTNAFAANFMPILDSDTEFAMKWASLATSHLNEGIRNPILAFEYMNRFYVQEGNKRVSVLKYFGAVTVPGTVKRILPKPQNTVESKIYFDFLDFYRLTKINYIWFSQPGRFKTLLSLLTPQKQDAKPDVWTDERRSELFSAYIRFHKNFKALGGDKLQGTTGDAFLGYLKLHSLSWILNRTDSELKAEIIKSWTELAAYSIPKPVDLKLDPVETPKSKSVSLLDILMPPKQEPLRALFLYERAPETSAWAHAHEQGRQFAETTLNGLNNNKLATWYQANVSSSTGDSGADAALDIIRQGVVKEGANVVFTTSSQQLPVCLKAAAEFPDVKFLNCSVYSPHPSIRTYYGRMYEVKFLAGLIAGAMTQSHKIGYVADYPIYGTTAAINAFALGVRMTDPSAGVFVEWRAQYDRDVWNRLITHGVDMIAGLDIQSPVDIWRAHGLYSVDNNGVGQQILTWSWNWGKFYERILANILDGNWSDKNMTVMDGLLSPKPPVETPKAVNYWWGLSAGVVDFSHTNNVPRDTLRLARFMKDSMIAGRFRPFEGTLITQDGRVIDNGSAMSPEDIVKMDWLAENVTGTIPSINDVTPDVRELIRLQGVRSEDREMA